MSEQQVPWAPGRRALTCAAGQWWEEVVGVVGVPNDGNEDGDNTPRPCWETVRPHGRADGWAGPTREDAARSFGALLPGQHPCCHKVDTHAPGCERGKRIETNLARGVPAFWAEWAMWALPSGDPGTCAVFELRSYEDGTPRVIGVLRRDWRGLGEWGGGEFSRAPDGCASTFPLIALGPEGPTLAPWGLG